MIKRLSKLLRRYKFIFISVLLLSIVSGGISLSYRYGSYSEEKVLDFDKNNYQEDYIYLTVYIKSYKDPRREQNFSINLNNTEIFSYDDMYSIYKFDPNSNINLYFYDFYKQNLINYSYKLVFTVKSDVLQETNKLKIKMAGRNYYVESTMLEPMNRNINDKVGEMYKLLELVSYYKDQISMDYKNIFLAYSGYNKFKRLVYEAKLNPVFTDGSIKYFSVEDSLIDLTKDIVGEIHFDAKRQTILSDDSRAKDRYLELLGFYKNNRMVQSIDIEDFLTGG